GEGGRKYPEERPKARMKRAVATGTATRRKHSRSKRQPHVDASTRLEGVDLMRRHRLPSQLLLYCCGDAKGLKRLTIQRGVAKQAEASRPFAKILEKIRLSSGGETSFATTCRRGPPRRTVEKARTPSKQRRWIAAPRAHLASDQPQRANRHTRMVAQAIRTTGRLLRSAILSA